ncbi:PAS domain S-box-containing protein [Pontibacter aydingkolensis]|uniref:histidine kinase n=1 Tax=Pontibacter aydingkolensis TaxID=1911536 RepID=A0ABS7CR77_9BACT|nr:PAS domain-containing protein [Pontibacter aydingkolensis]MBW7466352.1 PAS domain-containing protein [Pontibacter aydingkolensis]
MLDLYKLLVHLPDAVVLLSPDLKVLEATDEYLRVTLRSREQLIGKDFLKEFPDNPKEPESKNEQLLRKSLETALRTKKPDNLDVLRYDIPRSDGSFDVRYWEAVHTPVLDEAGNVSFIIQKTSDITERELNKHALAVQESKFRFMADAMPQLIYMTDENGTITYYNKRWFDYTGNSASDLQWEKSIHPDDLEVLKSKWKEAQRSVTPLQAEVRMKDAEGRYRWHLTRAVPMRGEDGKVMMWVGSSTDIHETRLLVQELLSSNEQMVTMADQLQETYQKAEAERKIMEQLIQKAPFFCCILKGAAHRFELANENYQKLMPAKDLIGKTVVEALPEVVEQGFIAILDKVYQTGEEFVAENMPVKLDRYNTGKLEDVYVTFIYQAMRNEYGEIVGILVFGHDVTEQALLINKAKALGISLA